MISTIMNRDKVGMSFHGNVYTYLLAAGYLQIVSVERESYPWKYTLRVNVEATHALWDFMHGTKEASLQTKRR